MPLNIENISHRNGGNWVFRDVSFTVADGEVFGIVGPNGAGKADLIATIGGKGVAKPSFVKRLFGTTNESNGLADVENAIVSARSAICLNDPFRGLDNDNKRIVAEKIRSAAKQKNIPVVFSTSDFGDVLLACDRAAILAKGYLQQIGTPEQLYCEPETALIASLTGCNNLFEARRLTSSKAELPEFQTIVGEHRLFTQKRELRDLGSINTNAMLAIRPEQIVMSFGASFPEDNLIKGVISGIRFNGASTFVDLDCGGLMLTASVTRLIGLNNGDECMVGLPPDRIRVLAK